jgi:hypothetical protein
VQAQTTFSHQRVTLPFSPCHTNATDCDYTHVCVHLTSLFCPSLAIVFKLMCVCGLCVNYSKKCARNTFIIGESTNPMKQQKKEVDL